MITHIPICVISRINQKYTHSHPIRDHWPEISIIGGHKKPRTAKNRPFYYLSSNSLNPRFGVRSHRSTATTAKDKAQVCIIIKLADDDREISGMVMSGCDAIKVEDRGISAQISEYFSLYKSRRAGWKLKSREKVFINHIVQCALFTCCWTDVLCLLSSSSSVAIRNVW